MFVNPLQLSGSFPGLLHEIREPARAAFENRYGSSRSRTGWWDTKEHTLFLEGLEKYGRNWKKISKLVGTRSSVQTRTHAQKYFMKLQKLQEKYQPEKHTSPSSSKKRQRPNEQAGNLSTDDTYSKRIKAEAFDFETPKYGTRTHLFDPSTPKPNTMSFMHPGCEVKVEPDSVRFLKTESTIAKICRATGTVNEISQGNEKSVRRNIFSEAKSCKEEQLYIKLDEQTFEDNVDWLLDTSFDDPILKSFFADAADI